MRSVFTVIITCVGDSIARISQVATADYRVGIGGLAGLFPSVQLPRSVRAIF